MEMELAEQVGAEWPERTTERTRYRNGRRERVWDTRVGTVELQVPRVRDGTFFPSLLEPRRRAERALVPCGYSRPHRRQRRFGGRRLSARGGRGRSRAVWPSAPTSATRSTRPPRRTLPWVPRACRGRCGWGHLPRL